ncbi:hypothetical protein ACS0TY_017270 [Phlomoides rotata]
MASYASIVSLMNILDQIKNHPRFFNSLDKYQIESFGEKLDFFLDFVENYNSDEGISREEAEELVSQITSAAHEAEDAIESHIVDHIHSGSTEIISHSTRLSKVLGGMDSIQKKVTKVKEEREFNDEKPKHSMPAASSTPLTSAKIVGFDDELMQLLDVLTGQQSSQQIISIIGMGGMGKTTLARNVYESRLISEHFDIRAWATISQENDVKEIIKQLGDELGEGERLHKSLFNRRYLIILDDMWSSEVWDIIKKIFPDNNNGSRIVLTTRLSNVATHLHSVCIRINFLDEHKSWNLFCQEVFGQEDCPLELVGIGKKIVEQCKGLPLAIAVIGGLLRKSYRTEEYWQNVAKSINSVLSSRENGQCRDVLYLSYTHLPAHLKPCFLYMGSFREDCEIRISEIINLWVAEGLLKPNGVHILEEIAGDYLQDLIDRNLILACAHHSNGKIKSCRIHDLLRELCLWISNKENYFCFIRDFSIPQGMHRERRLVFHDKYPRYYVHKFFEALQSASLVRSVISEKADQIPVNCRLLRVLSKALGQGIEADFQNVNLRYIDFLHHCGKVFIPSSISLIWNLQTLIIERGQEVVAPCEIWKMRQLRHLKCSCIFIPDPPPGDEDDDSIVLGNLQTLKKVVNFRLSEEVCKRISNIKKLSIWYYSHMEGYDDGLYDNLQNLGRLLQLESLRIWCHKRISFNFLMNTFPSSLNKLSFGGYGHLWEDLSMNIGSLPQLEVLKLEVFSEGEWSCVEGGFLRLKVLQLYFCDLNSWTLESVSCFPVLENLVLINLSNLNEIPSEIGEIPTLQVIRLKDCTRSLAISAIKIKEEEESFGNDGLQIQIED